MKETIKLTVRLFLITAIAGFVLAFANSFTSPVIKAREKAQYEAALKEVFADADKFETVEEGKLNTIKTKIKNIEKIEIAKKSDKTVGYVFKTLGKNGYGMTFYNIGKNFYTEGTIVNKGSYEIMVPRGESGYDPNNVKKSIFRIHMSGEENTALYFSQAKNNYQLNSHKNFNIDSVDIVSENAKNNTLVRLERVDNFNLGGE